MEEHLPGAGKESDDDDSSQGSKGGEGGDKAGGDTEGKMPGQLQAEVPLAPNYHAKKADAKAAIKLLLGKEVLVKHKNKSMAWTVIEDWDPEEPVLESDTAFGLKSFDCTQYTQRDVLAHLFLHLSFADWRVTLDKMNQAINEANNNNNKKRVRVFSAEEFLTALGLMIGAAEYGGRGSQLWEGQADCCGREKWESLLPDPNFDGIMKQYRFKDFRHFFPFAFKSETLKNNNDPWWEFAEAVNEFNNNRKTKLKLPKWLIIDESMSSWKPRQSPTGGLPNISFILRKPKGVIEVLLPDATSERVSSVSSGAGAQELVIPERSLQDANGDLHHLVVYPLTQDSNGKKYRKSRDCKVCKDNRIRKLARKYCFTCGLSAACCSQDDGKDCFLSHVTRIMRRNGPRGGLIGV